MVSLTAVSERKMLSTIRTVHILSMTCWSGTTQRIKIGPHLSSALSHNTCSLQGCALSPPLYTFYPHDCAPTHPSKSIMEYVDNMTSILNLVILIWYNILPLLFSTETEVNKATDILKPNNLFLEHSFCKCPKNTQYSQYSYN